MAFSNLKKVTLFRDVLNPDPEYNVEYDCLIFTEVILGDSDPNAFSQSDIGVFARNSSTNRRRLIWGLFRVFGSNSPPKKTVGVPPAYNFASTNDQIELTVPYNTTVNLYILQLDNNVPNL